MKKRQKNKNLFKNERDVIQESFWRALIEKTKKQNFFSHGDGEIRQFNKKKKKIHLSSCENMAESRSSSEALRADCLHPLV